MKRRDTCTAGWGIIPSDRQWHDVQAIMQVQDRCLDMHYGCQSAIELQISELFDRLLAGQSTPVEASSQRHGTF